MIICYLGNIGEGKTLSVVKEIVDGNSYPITNFTLNPNVDHYRLKYSDLLNFEKVRGSKFKRPTSVNWDFWDELRVERKDFSIFLDEVHNIVHARASMTKRNILLSEWLSQIRKILSDSTTNNLYYISQTGRKIDVNFRELTHIVVTCHKKMIGEKVIIINKYYEGFEAYEKGEVCAKAGFVGNKYFKYYDSYQMVKFSDANKYL